MSCLSSFKLHIISYSGEILVEEYHGELDVSAVTPCVSHSGNGIAGMTGIHYGFSEAQPKRSHPDKRGRAAADTITSTSGLHLKHGPVRLRASREPRPCRAYRASGSTNRKRGIKIKTRGRRMSQI